MYLTTEQLLAGDDDHKVQNYYLLARNIIRNFPNLRDQEAATQDAVFCCWLHRDDVELSGNAFNYFSTLIINSFRLHHRNHKNFIRLREHYAQSKGIAIADSDANMKAKIKFNNAVNKKPAKRHPDTKGYSFHRGKYVAVITHHGVARGLGRFDTAEEAHQAYVRAVKLEQEESQNQPK